MDHLRVTNVRNGGSAIWEAVGLGLVDPNEVSAGYCPSLEYILDAIDPLLEIASDKVLITSDHGNALGERARPIPMKPYSERDL